MINNKIYFSGKIVELDENFTIDFNEPKIVTKQIKITTFEYQTVILPCEVENLPQEMSVIWQYGMRNETNQTVLTIGHTQIENNYRIRLITNITSNDQNQISRKIVYNLEIRKVNFKDSGWYECQLPTKPTKINYVHLEVMAIPKIEATSSIAEFGEPFELICKVRHLPQRYQLTWYLNGKKISKIEPKEISNYRNRRGHLSNWFNNGFLFLKRKSALTQSMKIIEEKFKNFTISRLRIEQISELHKGLFECKYDKVEAKYFLDLNVKARIQAMDQLRAGAPRKINNSAVYIFNFLVFFYL